MIRYRTYSPAAEALTDDGEAAPVQKAETDEAPAKEAKEKAAADTEAPAQEAPADEAPAEETAEETAEKAAPADDGNEPALVETEEEPKPAENYAGDSSDDEYVNISNPEDDNVYEAPKAPATPQEQMQMAIDSIEKRSKYLDEPNVISDEAINDIVSQIRFFNDEDYE